MLIAVDFDGTIADHCYPEIGKPVPGAFEWLKAFKQAGASLFLWTMRDGDYLVDAIEFCKKHGVEFDGHNNNPSQSTWTTSPKCYAHLYIDDAAFGCPICENPRMGGRPYVNWDVVGPQVLDMINNK